MAGNEINIDLTKIRENGIFLMLPAYGGQCFAAFAHSIMRLGILCAQYQIPFDTFFIYNESLIPRARNYCADAFLRAKYAIQLPDGNIEERYYKHGLFIDSDIEFNPVDILVLAHFQNTRDDFDVVCGPYPKKIISWEKIKRAVEKGFADDNPNELEKFVGDYVFNLPDGHVEVKLDSPFQVLEAGTGFMMFKRDTLLKIAEDNPHLSYLPDHSRSDNFDGSREITAFFDCCIDPKTRRYLSEDYYFCQLVYKSNLKVWMVPWYELKHHGYFIYSGSLGAMASAGVAATVDKSQLKKGKNKK